MYGVGVSFWDVTDELTYSGLEHCAWSVGRYWVAPHRRKIRRAFGAGSWAPVAAWTPPQASW
jgi:hypothetical protein